MHHKAVCERVQEFARKRKISDATPGFAKDEASASESGDETDWDAGARAVGNDESRRQCGDKPGGGDKRFERREKRGEPGLMHFAGSRNPVPLATQGVGTCVELGLGGHVRVGSDKADIIQRWIKLGGQSQHFASVATTSDDNCGLHFALHFASTPAKGCVRDGDRRGQDDDDGPTAKARQHRAATHLGLGLRRP